MPLNYLSLYAVNVCFSVVCLIHWLLIWSSCILAKISIADVSSWFSTVDAKHKSSDGEFVPQTRPRSNTLPKSFGSSLDHEDDDNEDEARVIQKEKKPSKEATLELILKRLKEKRVERCLPEDIKVILSYDVWPD